MIHWAPPLIVASCPLPELSAAVVPVPSLKFQAARRPIVDVGVLETMSLLMSVSVRTTVQTRTWVMSPSK